MDDILNTLTANSYSISNLKQKIRILKTFLSTHFFGGTPEQLTAQDQNFLNSLSQEFFQKFNKDNINQIFSYLDENLHKLSTLTVYLPFEANEEAVKSIALKARELFNKTLILDIKYDPLLIAGCALVWNGVYKDYSLRARIEEKKQELFQGFKKFLR